MTASLPAGEYAESYTYFFGDGTNNTIAPGPGLPSGASHIYGSPGTYLIYATARVAGSVHDSLSAMVELSVKRGLCADCPYSPVAIGTILANSTSTIGATAILQPGESVTVMADYGVAPTDTANASTIGPPTLTAPSGTSVSALTTTPHSVQATVTFPDPGFWTISSAARSQDSSGFQFENYTWSVYVGHGTARSQLLMPNPHEGTLLGYELAPGGAQSEDPAIDYETVGAEPIMNVYQTLLAYNRTDVGPTPEDFVPVLSACVPGSPACAKLYGTKLADGVNFTFVVQANASFYDPSTQASWGVYPSDVVFSMARSLGFSTLPAPTIRPGWILAQALLSPGNATWDPIHGAYNNTPQEILGAMSVNDSRYCPRAAIIEQHGCVTFHAYGGGHSWGFFLELLAQPLGGSIVPCGWFSAARQGAGIPYWSQGNVTGYGDRPCPMPGLGMGIAPAQIPPTGWDGWEESGSGSVTGQFPGNVQWSMVGSGPYYLDVLTIASGYTLKASPAYRPNPFCSWTGCPPEPGRFAATVSVTWETSESPGEQALRSGAADFATIPADSIGLLLNLVQAWKLNAVQAPTLSLGFTAFNMNFSLGSARRLSTNPISVPSDFFSYLGMREFLVRAYPYQTIQSTINTRAGIELGFQSGGAIPRLMGSYYSGSIPWPSTDPCTDNANPTCPAYWLTQMRTPSSAYYDPEIASCRVSNPCEFPIFGTVGDPASDQTLSLWRSSVGALSNHTIAMDLVDVNFPTLVVATQTLAGENPLTVYGLSWTPDYPDPTDYTTPLYAANSTYTEGDAVAQSIEQPRFVQSCSHPGTEPAYWSSLSMIPQSCQGVAYQSLVHALDAAASETNLTRRVAEYAQAEEIAYQLYLYVYTGQSNEIFALTPWWNIDSVDTNPMLGGDYLFSVITPGSLG